MLSFVLRCAAFLMLMCLAQIVQARPTTWNGWIILGPPSLPDAPPSDILYSGTYCAAGGMVGTSDSNETITNVKLFINGELVKEISTPAQTRFGVKIGCSFDSTHFSDREDVVFKIEATFAKNGESHTISDERHKGKIYNKSALAVDTLLGLLTGTTPTQIDALVSLFTACSSEMKYTLLQSLVSGSWSKSDFLNAISDTTIVDVAAHGNSGFFATPASFGSFETVLPSDILQARSAAIASGLPPIHMVLLSSCQTAGIPGGSLNNSLASAFLYGNLTYTIEDVDTSIDAACVQWRELLFANFIRPSHEAFWDELSKGGTAFDARNRFVMAVYPNLNLSNPGNLDKIRDHAACFGDPSATTHGLYDGFSGRHQAWHD